MDIITWWIFLFYLPNIIAYEHIHIPISILYLRKKWIEHSLVTLHHGFQPQLGISLSSYDILQPHLSNILCECVDLFMP